MVQRAAPARTERNWINGSLGAAQQNTGNVTFLKSEVLGSKETCCGCHEVNPHVNRE